MILSALAAALLAAATPAPHARTCLNAGSAGSTHYHPVDDHTIVIESGSRWYRLEVTPTSGLTDPTAIIVSDVRGSSLQCEPVDFDLSVVSPPGGGRVGMIAQSFQAISAEEGKALERRARR